MGKFDPNRLNPDTQTLQIPHKEKQTQGLSQVPTLEAMLTSSYNHQVEAESQALHEKPSHTILEIKTPKHHVLQAKVGGKFASLTAI